MRKINYKISVLIILLLLLSGNFIYCQTVLVAKFSPLGIHPFKEKNSHIFENRLDANALFVVEPSFTFGTETFLRDDSFSLRFLVGGMSDAVSKPAFYLHAGVKQRILQIWRSSIAIGVGANLYGRERWSTIDDYIEETSWKANGSWEYNFGVMAELEYILMLNQRNDLLFSIAYGIQPRTFSVSVGYRFWLSTIIKHPKNCGSCPFQKKKKKGRWHL